MSKLRNRNWHYIIGITIVRAIMVGAAVASYQHIVEAAHMLGLHGWEASSAPLLIDSFAALGMLGRTSRFAEETRRIGLRLAIGAGAVSLVANVYAGQNRGEQIYGGLVVAGFLVAEQYADRMRPAESATAEDPRLAALRAELDAAKATLADSTAASQRTVAAATADAQAAIARADAAEQALQDTQAAATRELRKTKRDFGRQIKDLREAVDLQDAAIAAELAMSPGSNQPISPAFGYR